MKKFTIILGIIFLTVSVLVSPAQAVSFTDINKHWAGADIAKMTAKGIIKESGKFYNPDQLLSRQQAVEWLLYLVKPGDLSSAMEQAKNKFPAGIKGVDQYHRGVLAMAEEEGIISESELRALKWNQAVSRQEVAIWLSKAVKLMPVVTADEYLNRFIDRDSMDILQAPYIVPLIKDNVIVGSNGYFNPNQAMRRGEMAALLSRADRQYMSNQIVRSRKGQIVSFANWPYKSITVKNTDGTFTTLAQTNNSKVFYNRMIANISYFNIDDGVEYVADYRNALLYLENSAGVPTDIPSIWGVNNWAPNYPGYVQPVGTDWPFAVPGTDSNIPTYNNDTRVQGEVREINYSDATITILTDYGGKRYDLRRNLLEKRGGSYYYDRQRIAIGDEIEIVFLAGEINQINVLWGRSNYEYGTVVYRAELDSVDTSEQEIRVSDLEKLRDGRWRSESGDKYLDVYNADIYYRQERISINKLRNYEDETIYILCYDDEVEKLIVAKGSISSLDEEIKDVYNNRLKLENNRTIYWDDDTICIDGDKTRDVDDLYKGEEIFVIYERDNNNSYRALVIEVN